MYAVMFTDGSAKPNPGNTGIGVVIYDKHNKVLDAFSQNTGQGNSDYAEYQALLTGIKKAKELGVKDLACKTDSKNLVNHFYNWKKFVTSKNPELHDIIVEIKKLANDNFNYFTLQHISRIKNKEADRYSKLGLLQDLHDYPDQNLALKAFHQEIDSLD